MIDNTQTIQWFPGHMAKTRRKIGEQLKLIDAVAEIVDADLGFTNRLVLRALANHLQDAARIGAAIKHRHTDSVVISQKSP